MILASLPSWIAFFQESSPAPFALPFPSSQEPCRKKQQSQRAKQTDPSELMPAQILHDSVCPEGEDSLVLFSCGDQCSLSGASSLVYFGGSNEDVMGMMPRKGGAPWRTLASFDQRTREMDSL
ncbi:hypothetical protein Q8A67_009355 [Cirrhinus molitorella]|uniref:Uncharacterized protein n=1 Tax=Cirrhinus molitorella TaxID=172907 RepID=A0AA88Q6G7_9TELE|nr:hypothetical protein Q8A67_009355 [Cirrhinus molitorella]